MADNDVCDVGVQSIVDGIEEDYTPECMKENHTQSLSGAGEKEDVGAAQQANCCWTDLQIERKRIC